ncbi:mannosidase 2 [Capsaspora owczarzaki ATCC 30864]|uniref:mannosidase 2 n=2 Tax=Capsaspora owczarzaki (strain ATCC 30864) TaxID=595528 RepID=UPI0003523584|nr:mannosidase 2 [Capsaspora owczarzaki ATCC 30864]|eukprot:XP_004364269.2 mannosidase 2 [Capsaspora owczarzaki ATCC 30864]
MRVCGRGSRSRVAIFLLALALIAVASFTLPSLRDDAETGPRGALPDAVPAPADKQARVPHERKPMTRNHLRQVEVNRANANQPPVPVKRQPVLQEEEHEELRQPEPELLRKPIIAHKPMQSVSNDGCAFIAPSTADHEMRDFIESMPFDNLDGGVWKQGWDVQYAASEVQTRKLDIYVVPHSHNDPGWIKTFDAYYSQQTKSILDTVVNMLSQNSKRKFIWAEMSYLQRWWDEQTSDRRELTRRLVDNGQLEIVTGGWVMSDEANAYYYAMIDQLIEGHEWLASTLGVTPKSGWSIDPFGQSSAMPYFLRRTGFESMLIQRTHYSVKKYLARNRGLEFMWRQEWDAEGTTDILTHMMPFYSYDIPHTCGPEPAVCCQFDFARLPGQRFSCPWNIPPQVISTGNVKQRAQMLVDQYRKKAQLYKSDVVFVPLGDDFRWQGDQEALAQYENYERLFKELNGDSKYNVRIQWGTLSDYFGALRESLGTAGSAAPPSEFALAAYGQPHQYATPTGIQSMTGDFFTYADRDDHYWSGYFTTRAFYKRADRVLEYTLRSAEIMLSVARAEALTLGVSIAPFLQTMYPAVVTARRNLGLYQHHDGVTGTAKDEVVIDYGARMHSSIGVMQTLMRDLSEFLLATDKHAAAALLASGPRRSLNDAALSNQANDHLVLHLGESAAVHNALPTQEVLKTRPASASWSAGAAEPTRNANARAVVLYNSLGQSRAQTIILTVATSTSSSNGGVRGTHAPICVTDSDGTSVLAQTGPLFDRNGEIVPSTFSLAFEAQIPAVGLATYFVHEVASDDTRCTRAEPATVQLFNALQLGSNPVTQDHGAFKVTQLSSGPSSGIVLENSELRVTIEPADGMIQKAVHKNSGKEVLLNENYLKYSTYRSGAYLFLPNGPAASFVSQQRPSIRTITGPLLHEAHVVVPTGRLTRVARLYLAPSLPHAVERSVIETRIVLDITADNNKETIVRFSTSVRNGPIFFTDLNGFQMIRRKTQSKLPLQGNYYPMPSLAFLEDESIRFSVHSRQALGCASLKEGTFEMMLDRRLSQDDERGLGQGIHDNHENELLFHLTLEDFESPHARGESTGVYFEAPSLLSHLAREELNEPPIVFLAAHLAPKEAARLSWAPYSALSSPLPCDVHLVNLRSLSNRDQVAAGLIVQRRGRDCSLRQPDAVFGLCGGQDLGSITPYSLLAFAQPKDVTQHTLTLMHPIGQVARTSPVVLSPMELYSYVVTF